MLAENVQQEICAQEKFIYENKINKLQTNKQKISGALRTQITKIIQ